MAARARPPAHAVRVSALVGPLRGLRQRRTGTHKARASSFSSAICPIWVGSLAYLSENSDGGCYAELLETLAREVEAALALR
jgi:hypothetical protein